MPTPTEITTPINPAEPLKLILKLSFRNLHPNGYPQVQNQMKALGWSPDGGNQQYSLRTTLEKKQDDILAVHQAVWNLAKFVSSLKKKDETGSYPILEEWYLVECLVVLSIKC